MDDLAASEEEGLTAILQA